MFHSKNGKAFTAKWKTNSSATGYHLQYARNNKFSGAKNVKITNRKTISKKTNFGVKGKCYVRVRTYKTVNGVNFLSDWSNVRSLRNNRLIINRCIPVAQGMQRFVFLLHTIAI